MAMSNVLRALVLVSALPMMTALTAASKEGMQVEMELEAGVNPIRPIVNMLQALYKNVKRADEKMEERREDMECLCKKQLEEAQSLVARLEAGLPELQQEYAEYRGIEDQLWARINDIESQIYDVKADKRALIAAYEKEHTPTTEEIARMAADYDQIAKAIRALRRAAGQLSSAFLQTSEAEFLRNLTTSTRFTVKDSDRDTLAAFLDESNEDGSQSPGTEEIIGILVVMQDTLEKEIRTTKKGMKKDTENLKDLLFEKDKILRGLEKDLLKAKENHAEAKLKAIETKKEWQKIMDGGLTKAQKALLDLQVDCEKKREAFDQEKKLRTEEMRAILATIDILNKDNALEIFKKTLPPGLPRFLQVEQTKHEVPRVREARKALAQIKGKHRYKIDLIELSMNKKLIDYDEINTMIHELVKELKDQQFEEEQHVEKCRYLMNKYSSEHNTFVGSMKALEADIAAAEAEQEDLQKEMDKVMKEVEELDALVNETRAKEMSEHYDRQKEISLANQAQGLLIMAKRRLADFYAPEMNAPIPSASFVQGKVQSNASAKEDPVIILHMLKKLIKNLEVQMYQQGLEDQRLMNALTKYEFEKADERSALMRDFYDKQRDKTQKDGKIIHMKNTLKQMGKHDEAVMKMLGSTHAGCDWLIENVDYRYQARQDEIKSLNKAEAILAGADYTKYDFLQEGQTRNLVKRSLRLRGNK